MQLVILLSKICLQAPLPSDALGDAGGRRYLSDKTQLFAFADSNLTTWHI